MVYSKSGCQIFPNAVAIIEGIIPNEMRDISYCDWSGNKIIVPDLSGSRYKLYYKWYVGIHNVVDYVIIVLADASYNDFFYGGRLVIFIF